MFVHHFLEWFSQSQKIMPYFKGLNLNSYSMNFILIGE
jgi:hypothetical protein